MHYHELVSHSVISKGIHLDSSGSELIILTVLIVISDVETCQHRCRWGILNVVGFNCFQGNDRVIVIGGYYLDLNWHREILWCMSDNIIDYYNSYICVYVSVCGCECVRVSMCGDTREAR